MTLHYARLFLAPWEHVYIIFPSCKTTHHLTHLNTNRASEALHLTSSCVRHIGITDCKKIEMTASYISLESDIGSFVKTGQPFWKYKRVETHTDTQRVWDVSVMHFFNSCAENWAEVCTKLFCCVQECRQRWILQYGLRYTLHGCGF
jgi:hypothetical protein